MNEFQMDPNLWLRGELTSRQRATIDDLRASMIKGVAEGTHERVIPPLQHYHADGLYGRRIFVQPDTTVTTKVHKKEHITVALKGHCTVVDEQGNTTEVYAPAVFITKPGTQRAIYCHDEVEWITVHACEEQEDLEKIEALLVCDSMTDYLLEGAK